MRRAFWEPEPEESVVMERWEAIFSVKVMCAFVKKVSVWAFRVSLLRVADSIMERSSVIWDSERF